MATFKLSADNREWLVDDKHLQDTYAMLDEIQRRGHGVLWLLDLEGEETFLYLSRHTPVAITFNSYAMSVAIRDNLPVEYRQHPEDQQPLEPGPRQSEPIVSEA
ncbi:Uncharacterised protein [Actinomyces bovis]|uniref:Uncharacterized protein n=1 Tax=Actinomyces bovis TaxID=1658 RepID=A0ABY1VKW7_9ACTO|nr:hypothetical protein [Actinomyces bovis]SPT52739.1 Uncharacterised protein [Actinomyces bovis]VEG54723.1 Uncharacterised protein [Actinomyces israelii]